MSDNQPKQFRADTDPEGGTGVASSSLTTSHQKELARKKAAITAAKKSAEIASSAIPMALRGIATPSGVALVGIVGMGILLHTLFSMSPSAQIAAQNQKLNQLVENQQRTNEQILDTMAQMNKTATRPTINVALAQWDMGGTEPGYQGSASTQQVAVNTKSEEEYYKKLHNLFVNDPNQLESVLVQWRPAIQAGDQSPAANAIRRLAAQYPEFVRL